MDFEQQDDEEDDLGDNDQEKMESAENMEIISELQQKQQQIALKKDGLLNTEQSSVDEKENRISRTDAALSKTDGQHDESQSSEQHVDHLLEELPEVHPPFLPTKDILDQPYTLVLDLDETLIHFVSS